MATNMRIISMSVEPEFDGVVSIVDQIARDHGTSHSNIYRTIIHDFFGVPTSNPEAQQFFMGVIERAMDKKQEVKC